MIFQLFQDSSIFTYSFNNNPTERTANIINEELNQINNSLKANKIKVKVYKRNIIFSYRKQIIIPNTQLGSENIEVTDSIKFLGFAPDGKQNFKCQVTALNN